MTRFSQTPEVTVIVVSFNTRDLTCKALETLIEYGGDVSMQVIVWDNASHDGSADAVEERFKQVEVIRSDENLGFGRANNEAGKHALGEFVLLLNSDTETLPGAVEKLLDFAKAHPEAGIVGGRTLFADGSLNKTSVLNALSPWSLICSAFSLTQIFPNSSLFNPELIGGWQRDDMREVDIVAGCWLMLTKELWDRLEGFNQDFFMYGEDADLCLRTKKMGYKLMMCPEAEIVHLGGASMVQREEKLVQLMRGRVRTVRSHWNKAMIPLGVGLIWLWIAVRYVSSWFKPAKARSTSIWPSMWASRGDWLKGW